MGIRAHFEALCYPRNPALHQRAHIEARAYIQKALEDMGRKVQFQEFSTELSDTDGKQVIGTNVLAEALEQPRLLVVAHYDTVDHCPGADDNLSAIAAALEIARRCPNVHVIFPDLEETGLLGARHFVSSGLWADVPSLVLESVGYWSSEAGSQSFPEVFPLAFPKEFQWLRSRQFRADFLALLHLPQDAALARSLSTQLGEDTMTLEVPVALLCREEGKALRDFGRSDHLAFWEQARSCLMLTDSANFRNPNYHRPSDTVETLDMPKLEALVDTLCSWCLSFTDS